MLKAYFRNQKKQKKQIFCCKYLQKSGFGVILKTLKLQSGPILYEMGLTPDCWKLKILIRCVIVCYGVFPGRTAELPTS